MENIAKKIKDLKISYKSDIFLKNFTTTRTGGKITFMFYPISVTDLIRLITFLKKESMKFVVLGSMTNVAISSKDLNLSVINMSNFLNEFDKPVFDEKSNIVTVPAGYEMKLLCRWAAHQSIDGLQWMEGIPGTVGAGAFMNAGFLAGEDFEHTLVDADVLMPDMTIQKFTNKRMDFSYRKSSIQNNGGIILSVRLLVRKGKKLKIILKNYLYHRRRSNNQPLEYPSAGTVFIPPTPFHVGGMLNSLKLVGYKIGDAQISTKSPGFIINTGNMTGEDYYQLVKFIQKQIKNNYGIELVPEVRLIGFNDAK